MFSDNFRRGEGNGKGRSGSKAISKMADIGWKAFQAVNTALPEGKSIQPGWAAEPLLKSYERTAPPLGFPRETDSLCPACVKSVRNGVISGDIPLNILIDAHPGEIKAQIVEENGQVIMRKTCPTHGEFEDVLATDADFLRRIEGLFQPVGREVWHIEIERTEVLARERTDVARVDRQVRVHIFRDRQR